jgi:cytochrome P450
MMRTTFEVILETMLSGDGSFDPAEFGKNMTASLRAMNWAVALGLLSLHRDSETRIMDEVEDVTRGRELLPEDVEKLSYTRQAVQEAMRLYPPAPLISRDATRDLRLGDEPVAAGTTLLIPIYAVHRHKTLWPDPDRFDPDRFAPEEVRQRHRYSYIPFGAGPRICIGMNFALTEATAILASLVRAVRLDLPDGFAPTLKMGITLRAGEGMRMLMRPR